MRPTRTDWLVAGVCGAWVIYFDGWHGVPSVALGSLTVLTLLFRRRPLLASIGVLLLVLLLWALESPLQSPAMLAPCVAYQYALGRYGPLRTGLIVLVMFDLGLWGRSGWQVPDLLFGLVVLGGPWVFGRLIRNRADGAQSAEQLLAEQAGRDPVAAAAAVVAAERCRLASEVVDVVRTAVVEMRLAAADAAVDLRPAALASIQEIGSAAVAELRRLLGLLRQDAALPVQHDISDHRGRTLLVDVSTAAGLAVLMHGEAWLDGAVTPPLSILLSTLLAATVALRRVDPVLACVAATAITATSIALRTPLLEGVAAGVVLVLLAWSVSAAGGPRGWAALAAFAVTRLAGVHLATPGTEAINVVALTLGGFCGYLWAERSRVEQLALSSAAALRDESQQHIDRAIKAERLRVARELHDVTSHAVTVMVLQAGAAAALRGRDDTAARAAVVEVERAGRTVLSELAVLAHVLDPEAASIPDNSVRPLNARLALLIERLRIGGVTVTADIDRPPAADPVVEAAVHRVVQESLTNVLRHAPGSSVHVSVRLSAEDPETVVVEIRDNGRSPASSAKDSGFGLVGLAERVRVLGGDLAAGPHPDGGFAVRARLPLRLPAPPTLDHPAGMQGRP